MNAKINMLTSMRFFAAFAVVIYHMRDYSLLSLRGGPLEKAHLAVDLFFVLSGYILAHVYGAAFAEKKANVRAFFVARMARIYPAHVAMMVVFLLYVAILGWMGFAYNAERYRPESFIWHIALLDATGVDKGLTWNFPAWSISAEFFAYLMFPFIARPVMRLSPRAAWYSLLVLIVAFMLLNGPLRMTERTVDFSIIRIIPEFLMGMLVYRARSYLGLGGGNWNGAFVFAVLILVVSVWAMAPDAIIVADVVAIIALGAAVTGLPAALLSWRPLVYLGEASYSLYLVHAFVLSVLYNAYKIPQIASVVPAAFRDLLVLIVVLPAASVLYHLVEKPSRNFIRRMFADAEPIPPAERVFP